jgi:hypothetical protein
MTKMKLVKKEKKINNRNSMLNTLQLQNHKNNDKLLTLDDLKCDVELDKKKE